MIPGEELIVYLFHLEKPLSRGVSAKGKQLQAGHYIGITKDLVGRILDHGDSTWEPLDEPVTLEDGPAVPHPLRGKRIRTGTKHGNGSTFLAVCNARGIAYELVRTWSGPGVDRTFERRLKNLKNSPKLCPVCNPDSAMKWMRLETGDSRLDASTARTNTAPLSTRIGDCHE